MGSGIVAPLSSTSAGGLIADRRIDRPAAHLGCRALRRRNAEPAAQGLTLTTMLPSAPSVRSDARLGLAVPAQDPHGELAVGESGFEAAGITAGYGDLAFVAAVLPFVDQVFTRT